MLKFERRTIIISIVVTVILLAIITAFVLCFFPGAVGVSPQKKSRILITALAASAVTLVAGWSIEAMFGSSGRSEANKEFSKNKQEAEASLAKQSKPLDAVAEKKLSATELSELFRLRYGRRWRRKVKIVLVQGSKADMENAAPGLVNDIWQEGDGSVLIYGGEAGSEPDEALLAELKSLRSRNSPDGIVLVMNAESLPPEHQCDLFRRKRQKADRLLGWQAPVWIWLTQATMWPQNTKAISPVAAMFGPDADSEFAMASIGELITPLRQAGMTLALADSRNNWHLDLASRLQHEFGATLKNVLRILTEGPSACRLRGVLFQPALTAQSNAPHTLAPQPGWQALLDDVPATRPRKLTTDWLQVAKLALIAALGLWCAGTLLSLTVNRTQIYQAQETARLAADNRMPLADRLQNQLKLQQTLARLQHRQATGAPWYARFGLNQDSSLLAALWPLYARNNNLLMRDAAVVELKSQLDAFIRLPPASSARLQGTRRAYDLLKGYLMLSRPDKADAEWLAKNTLALWPKRAGVRHGVWRSVAPKLMGFWAQNFPAHPQWKIAPEAELTGTVRQILLKQIGQRNAESGLYQEMLKRIARNWPDLTLAEMTGDTDASTLFHTDEIVPGMFTRQAWEEQVQQAIAEVVNARRDEIDWVLTDKAHQPGSDISPETLKERLTERYFADFGNAWLNMVNSIQWQDADSLSEAIGQLILLADVRQSPLVALMNTLAWQGKTGEKSAALADTLVDSAKQLMGRAKKPKPLIAQAQGPKGPLDAVFGPLTGLMQGKDGTGNNGNLSFQSWLARVTQVRLKLQQVTSAPDPQAMAQMLAQTVFQGKSIDLTDTRDYGSLVAASLGQEWNGFGQALFVQPLDLAWRQVLAPAAKSLNARWQSTLVQQWNNVFASRYPFKATGSDASLPLLALFLRADSGRISEFLKSNLGGILHQEGNRWVMDPSASQGMRMDPAFLTAINQLAAIADVIFPQGDAGLRFELMARPSKDIARMQLAIDGQHLDYFNQMEGWQSFRWPGETYYPGATLNWRTVTSGGMRLYDSKQGNWGWIRLLDKAQVTPLDSSRAQLVWLTPDNKTLKFILRSELGEGPLALLKLRGFRLPENIFDAGAEPPADAF